MAPSFKGANPAPNYTVAMNRVQTQIEAQLRIVRSFMPSRAPPTTKSSSLKPTPSFSALASASASTPPHPATSTSGSRQRTQHHDNESLFAETRAQDPNVGLGFGASLKQSSSEQARARENQLLRSRLLGRKRGAEDGTGRRGMRGEESSDEEAGRSGLGRAKKRARRAGSQEGKEEVGDEEEEEEVGREEVVQPVIAPEVVVGSDRLEKVGGTQSRDEGLRNDELGVEDAHGVTSLHEDSVPDGAEDASEQKMKKRRKRKKRNKDKPKERKGE